MSAGALKTADRRVLREARTEAVVVLLLDVALLVGLAVGDKAKGPTPTSDSRRTPSHAPGGARA